MRISVNAVLPILWSKDELGENMRLIDADALEKKLHELALDEWNHGPSTSWSNAYLECEDMVYNAPTVDAVPLEDYKSMESTVSKLTQALANSVKHGHWDNKIIDARFDTPHTIARCSNCKGKIWVYAENYVVRYPYCPLCGAKMDEVEDE